MPDLHVSDIQECADSESDPREWQARQLRRNAELTAGPEPEAECDRAADFTGRREGPRLLLHLAIYPLEGQTNFEVKILRKVFMFI